MPELRLPLSHTGKLQEEDNEETDGHFPERSISKPDIRFRRGIADLPYLGNRDFIIRSLWRAQGSRGIIFIGLKLSLIVAAVLGLHGFVLGPDRLISLLSNISGTDNCFNRRVDAYVDNFFIGISRRFVLTVLTIIIIGAFGYLFLMLSCIRYSDQFFLI
jgi:hypothetical protein